MLITLGAVIFGIVVIYKVLTRNTRKAVLLIATSLGVKPALVDGMLKNMNRKKGELLIDSVVRFPDVALNQAVYTLFIYRIFVVNQHPNEVSWWIERLESKGFDKHLDAEKVEIASMYLSECIDVFDLRNFVKSYNEKYS
ncbi:DUF1198 family protein [Pseudomonas gingeri]|uniref:DUF1198 family protein n=1 Tax=Pseudomonas gingeri TaxID=117681 RepID=UPI0015A1EC7D|nr:DUF1198 family protein [Pseudomonas gingeri]NVZ63024.1 DUF1198 family protein [Pseudomonas gingeri]